MDFINSYMKASSRQPFSKRNICRKNFLQTEKAACPSRKGRGRAAFLWMDAVTVHWLNCYAS